MKQHILRFILFSSLISGAFGFIYWYTNTYYNGFKAPDEPFPSIPVYPRHAGNALREETTTLVTDTFITTDTNDVVYQWYFQELPKQGWQPQQPYDNSYEYSLLRYETSCHVYHLKVNTSGNSQETRVFTRKIKKRFCKLP